MTPQNRGWGGARGARDAGNHGKYSVCAEIGRRTMRYPLLEYPSQIQVFYVFRLNSYLRCARGGTLNTWIRLRVLEVCEPMVLCSYNCISYELLLYTSMGTGPVLRLNRSQFSDWPVPCLRGVRSWQWPQITASTQSD